MNVKTRFFIICLFLLILWCQTGFAETIKIGEINPLSGRFAKQGLEVHQGVAVAVAEANEAGGIGGRLLELVSRDDQSRPDVAMARAEELCAWEKVVCLTGGYVDSLVGPVSQVSKKYRVPYVASASLQQELIQGENPYFFRVSHLRGFVEPLCELLYGKLHPQRPAILNAATPGSLELGRDLEQCLKSQGINVYLVEKFRPGTPDFTPLIHKLADMGIDVVISGGFSPDHILLVRQLKESKVSLKAYIGPFGVAYDSFIQEMGEDADFLFSTCAWSPEFTMPGTQAVSQAFVQRFRRMFMRQPNTTNMHGYTSARALTAAMQKVIERGQPLTGEHLRQALTEIDLMLPMEHLVFGPKGDPRFYRHVIVQIQNGRLVVVYPPERATGKIIYPVPTWDQRN
jgi:branched-chain amino acid transport system substrate-binding protein